MYLFLGYIENTFIITNNLKVGAYYTLIDSAEMQQTTIFKSTSLPFFTLVDRVLLAVQWIDVTRQTRQDNAATALLIHSSYGVLLRCQVYCCAAQCTVELPCVLLRCLMYCCAD